MFKWLANSRLWFGSLSGQFDLESLIRRESGDSLWSDFALPFSTWRMNRHVLAGILVSSLIINILSLAFPLMMLQIYDRIIPNMAMNTLVLLVIGVSTALFLEALLRISRSYISAWSDAKFEHTIGCRAFSHVLASDIKSYEHEGAGIHLKRFNSLNVMRDFYAGQLISAIADMPFLVLILLIIGYIASWLVLVPIGILVLYLYGAFQHTGVLKKLVEFRQEHDDKRFNFIIETLNNIHTVKSTAMEAAMVRRYERLQAASAINDFDTSYKGALPLAQGVTLSQLAVVLVVAFGSIMVINGMLTIGSMAATTLLAGRVLQPVSAVVGVWSRLQTIRVARRELRELLLMPVENIEGQEEAPKIKGKIEITNLSFRYADNLPWLFQDLNLTIEPGDTIGIKGASLSGKSTLALLIMGLLRATQGKIKVDDKNIIEYVPASLRQQIGYMPQQGVLFNGTIMENLTMFQSGFEQNAKQIASVMGLDSIISQFPKGYDTTVGDQAIDTLPQGIRQRITVARALVKKPAIVIFDEANAAVDMQGDELLRKLLGLVAKQTTLIIFSHRPSILGIANKRFLLKSTKLKIVQREVVDV